MCWVSHCLSGGLQVCTVWWSEILSPLFSVNDISEVSRNIALFDGECPEHMTNSLKVMIHFQSQSCDYMMYNQLLWDTANHNVTIK